MHVPWSAQKPWSLPLAPRPSCPSAATVEALAGVQSVERELSGRWSWSWSWSWCWCWSWHLAFGIWHLVLDIAAVTSCHAIPAASCEPVSCPRRRSAVGVESPQRGVTSDEAVPDRVHRVGRPIGGARRWTGHF
ncbi:hypothetical protein T440DRAFT_172059 [Plenodomus tracheiphilus IPT5]|uniref:Uncharacterized protein n=1 Tax=Plenodomus tracheiphilus IPT5 TaxID=1408161 RepID=A0A6A7B1A4_9PLEO|nr:hypothetical protein T440DRAFT_172059 [Plenodomus tracheiphilus IPT5]